MRLFLKFLMWCLTVHIGVKEKKKKDELSIYCTAVNGKYFSAANWAAG